MNKLERSFCILITVSLVLGIFSCTSLSQSTAAGIPDNAKQETAQNIAAPETETYAPPARKNLTTEELSVISDYVKSLSYLVYFDDSTGLEQGIYNKAVSLANNYLNEERMDYTELSRLKELVTEQFSSYEDETRGSVSLMQWLAEKLDADVYVQISLSVETAENNPGYATAVVADIKCFDAANFELLSESSSRKNENYTDKSQENVMIMEALGSMISPCMEEAVAKAKKQIVKDVSDGFEYTLTVMNTDNAKIMNTFIGDVAAGTRKIKKISTDKDKTVYKVYFIGSAAELEKLIYEAVAEIPELTGFRLIMQREDSLTFDTGL